MIKTKVIKRYIQTLPIQDMIIRTDHLAESIQFELVNWIEDIDYSAEGWQWFIYYRTSIDPPVVTPITYTISEDGSHIYLLWEVDHNITRRSGNLDFQIRGKRDTDKGLIEWNSSVATINLGSAIDPDDHDTDENILEWYLNRMEQLAQSGVVDILAERERAMAVEAGLRTDLDAEIERSITFDNSIEQRVDRLESSTDHDITKLRIDLTNEINRSSKEDIRLTTELDAEVERAKKAESDLSKSIEEETDRAEQAERNLRGALEENVLNLTNKIESETERAEQEERNIHGVIEARTLELTNRIEAETERARQEERNIHGVIEARTLELSNMVEAETERATAAEQTLQDNIDNLNVSADEAVAAERERAMAAEKALEDKITAETDRATAAEEQLQTNIEAETQRATEAENTLRSDLTDAVNAEQSRAEAAEKALEDKIAAEQERAEEAEDTLKSDLTDLINAETKRAKDRENQIETDLTNELNSEVVRATGKESEIEAKLTSEINRSTLADANHDSAINQLSVDINNTKSELKTTIDAETSRAKDAERVLQNNIDLEEQRATQAEQALGNRITEVESSLTTDLQIIREDLNEEIQTRATETGALRTDMTNAQADIKNLRADIDAEIDRSTDEDERLSNLVDSINIVEVAAPEGVSHRYRLSFTKDGQEILRGAEIDIPLSDAISDGWFDEDTNELCFELSTGNVIKIPFDDLIQYYNPGPGLQLNRTDLENNEFSIKLDTGSGTQGILSTSTNGLKIDLSKYYPKPTVDNLLSKKQNILIEDTGSTDRYYPPVQIDPNTSIISLNSAILADLGIAYSRALDAYGWVINLSSTTINGKKIGIQTPTSIAGTTIRLYETDNGNPPIKGNVLIAGEEGNYRDSGFTIGCSVPADAKFTDTLYYPTTEDNPEGLFTRAEQVKLEGIEKGAEVNVQSDWEAEDGDAFIRNKPGVATKEKDGFMSREDKSKLDGIDPGAEVNVQPDWNQTDPTEDDYIKNKPDFADIYLPLAGGSMEGPINSQNILPIMSNTYDLGSDTHRYRDMYLTHALYLGNPADGKGIFYNSTTGGFDFIC